jgi:hypothetical protein
MLNASKYGEKDLIKGVSSSVIVGKLAKIGTGYMDLYPNIKMLKQYKPLMTNVTEEYKIDEQVCY